jgi:3-oxoacyl-[acyl-carrier protein] reductase
VSEKDLTGRTALVTGGASGIGLATVTRLARLGARVALDHLSGDPAGPAAAARLAAEGLHVIAVAGSVADPADAPAMVAGAIERLGGRLDLLVNNAGTAATRVPIPFADLDAVTDDLWAATLETNLVGAFRCVRAAAPALRAAKGAVVNVASVAALGGAGSSLAYAASKAGLVNLTRNIARALAPEVRVNAVAPGFVDTPWTAPWPEARKAATIDQTWLRRACRPEEVAEAILFLGFGATFVTGETLAVDGGRAR